MTPRSVFQRDSYKGIACEVAIWWTLRRARPMGEAVCRMFTHVDGHELRLEVQGQLVDSQVCRTDEEILDSQERWRAAFEAEGWCKE